MNLTTHSPKQSLNKTCRKAKLLYEEFFVFRVILINNFPNIDTEYE